MEAVLRGVNAVVEWTECEGESENQCNDNEKAKWLCQLDKNLRSMFWVPC